VSHSRQLIPLLGGPTAAGKSAVALALAERFDMDIISGDAMQVYRGMDIGTAKPTPAERARVRHHLIDVVTPAEAFSVADFVRRSERVIGEVLARVGLPLVVGGTGFYLRALSEGLPTVPAADAGVQTELWERFEREGLEPLVRELAAASPVDARRVQGNPRRVVRALEVLRRTGRPPSDFPPAQPAFRYDKVVLSPGIAVLKPRIEARAARMFQLGLVAEVRALLERYPQQLTAMQAIGYKEVAAYLAGRVSQEEAWQAVTLATLRYARRQLTWFRREPNAQRFPALAREVQEELGSWLQGLLR